MNCGIKLVTEEKGIERTIKLKYIDELYEFIKVRRTDFSTCLYYIIMPESLRKKLGIDNTPVVSDSIIDFVINSIIDKCNIEEFIWEVNNEEFCNE